MTSKQVSEIQMNRDSKRPLSIYKDEKASVPISLINRALEELTYRTSAGAQKKQKNNLDLLCNSLFSTPEKSKGIVYSMLDSGVTIREIFEVFIPTAARQLGDCWVKNALSFAEVTVATSKLQTLAREFDSLYIGSISSGASGPEVLIISPIGEQHTFGAQMISRQFKRLGASSYLSINNNLGEIKRIIVKHKFKLIGLSLADYKLCRPRSEVRSIIELIKKFNIPIIVGGSLTHSHKSEVKSLNVDMITDDAVKALGYFNLNFSKSNNVSSLVTI